MLYKVLNEDGTAASGGHGKWHLPKDGKPGRWMNRITEIVQCDRGYHACRERDLVCWLGPVIYEAERDETAEYIECDDKIVSGRMRLIRRLDTWNDRTARLFACDCAEAVVNICGDDDRPRKAIDTARKYADGKATIEQLDAAWAASGAAARAAAWDAAMDAAWAAAWAAARAAARHEQTANLLSYLRGEKP